MSTQGENKEENYIQTIEELNHDFSHECKQTFRGLRERNLFDFSNINNHAVLVWHVQYFIAPYLILKSFQNQMLLQQV